MKLLLYLIFLFSQAVPITASTAPLEAGWRVAYLLNPGSSVHEHQILADTPPLEVVESVEEKTSSSHGASSANLRWKVSYVLPLFIESPLNLLNLQRLHQVLYRVLETFRL